MSDHKPARNRLAIEANHFGLNADTAARLAARAESMGLLSDQMPEIDAVAELERIKNGLVRLQKAFHCQAAPHDDHMYEQGWDYAVDLMESEITDILEGE